ncbi:MULTISPECIES: hypothetical protein [Streptomyces]|uniref:hypothetical protein n=1 Tax=Streptomyces TaxID=1883 RepID=UPI000A970F31|nr:hypothetical protein [Streptomyces sp. NRRL F-5193]
MIFFYLLLIAAVTLIIVGSTLGGALYLLSTGVLVLIAAMLYLGVNSVARRRSAH